VPWTAWQHGSAAGLQRRSRGRADRALADRPRSGAARCRALVRALLAAYPAAKINVPALQRPDLGGAALRRCGFERETLNQWIMCRDLVEAGE
jgi:hypothetical protein